MSACDSSWNGLGRQQIACGKVLGVDAIMLEDSTVESSAVAGSSP